MLIPTDVLLPMLDREDLKRAVDACGVTGIDRRSPDSMRSALLQSRSASSDVILGSLAPTRVQALQRRIQSPEAVSPLSSRTSGRKRAPQESTSHIHGAFAAIDFETADYGRDSACAVAVIRVEDNRIVRKALRLIRPPRREFAFTYIHGIRWVDVAREPVFATVWRDLEPMLDGVSFLAAHNASFDKGVLRACCESAGMAPPALPFECTVKWARKAWNLRPTNLPAVCRHLDLPLKHHDAASDAEACACIMIAARKAAAGVPAGD